MYVYRLVLLILPIVLVASSGVKKEQSTLELVHILFRHGDRTTDRSTIYPKDPYANETYYPYGIGELIKNGKKRMYNVGKSFRARYDKFLGPIYTPDLLEASSSYYNRTKMTLQLVLAGLFKPTLSEAFDLFLYWQPIPFTTLPSDTDKIFLNSCPNYRVLMQKYLNSEEAKNISSLYKNTFDYIATNTGLTVNSFLDILLVYNCLLSEKQWGLKLPEWTKKVYPDPLKTLALKGYEISTANTDLRRVASGYLIKKIVDDSKGKIDGNLVPVTRKLFLYSGHDSTIFSLLDTLDVPPKISPSFGSHVIFELHKINGIYGFKIFYQDWTSSEPRLLKLPKCEEFCPIDRYIAIVENYFPNDSTCG